MKILIKIVLVLVSLSTFGQEGITFQIEELSKPEKLEPLKNYNDIYKNLINKDSELSNWDIENNDIDVKYNIIAKSESPDSLVNYGYQSFFNGMCEAYAHHRPFVLSPDMIWLLISQGFARHTIANPEKLRKHFVDYDGKLTIVVKSEQDIRVNPNAWNDIYPQITSQIAQHTGEDLINILTCDFSTTTSIEKVASEITIMEAMEPFFEYIIMYTVCGIPEITLQGTTEDWEEIRSRTQKLAKYDLEWWTKELDPILVEFVNASKGNINKPFWMNMFKYHSQEEYGAPHIIDGWIVKFYPYDKHGKRNKLDKLIGGNSLPEEIVKVDIKYIITDGVHTTSMLLELWAGFIGLEQNPNNFALTPKISWMLKVKDTEQLNLQRKIEIDNTPHWSGIELRIIDAPDVLKNFNVIYTLGLEFKKDVFIPNWMKDIQIGRLNIEGKISSQEKQKIINWFPNTDLNINGEKYNEGKNNWFFINRNEIPEEVLKSEKIWGLSIFSSKFKYIIEVQERLKNIEIEFISLNVSLTEENTEKLKTLFPNSKLYVIGQRVQ